MVVLKPKYDNTVTQLTRSELTCRSPIIFLRISEIVKNCDSKGF